MRLERFLALFSRTIDIQEEFTGLRLCLLDGLDRACQEVEHLFRPPVHNLIALLNEHGAMGVTAQVVCLGVLENTLFDESASAQMILARKQAIAIMGASRLVIRTIACNDADPLCKAGLRLGVALLRAGNLSGQREMQDFLYKVLMNTANDLVNTSTVAAIDGTLEGFLGSIRNRLRIGIKEITDRKIFHASQKERRGFLASQTKVGGTALASMVSESNKEFLTRAHVVDVLELLQALCEGHHEDFQNYLRDQPNQAFDIDIITEVVGLALAIEPELDAENINQMQAAMRFLTEVLQGECSRKNAKLVLETKLLIIVNRLLTKFPVDPEGLLTLSTITALRTQVLALLHSLIEGNEAGMVERMRNLLDLSGLAEAAYNWSARGGSEEQQGGGIHTEDHEERGGSGTQRLTATQLADKRRDAEAEYGNAKLMYVLLWQLLDPSVHGKPVGNKLAYSFLQEGHFRDLAARVEIVNKEGSLERIYFHLPNKCLKLSDQSKHQLLWGVDRDTPGRQIQQFLLAVDDLQLEMTHAVKLGEMRLYGLLARNDDANENLSILLAMIQAILMMAHTQISASRLAGDFGNSDGGSDDSGSGEGLSSKDVDSVFSTASVVVGSLQLLSCSVSALVHVMRYSIVAQLKLWKRLTGDQTRFLPLMAAPIPALLSR